MINHTIPACFCHYPQFMQKSRTLQQQQHFLSSLVCCCTCQGTSVRVPSQNNALREGRRKKIESASLKRHASTTGATLSSPAASPVPLPASSSSSPKLSGSLQSFFKQSFLARQLQLTKEKGAGRIASFAKYDGRGGSLATTLSDPDANKGSLDVIPSIANPSAAWRSLDRPKTLSAQLAIYKQLAKGRLSAWVVVTAMAGYAMCPTDPAAAALAMDALVQDTFGSASITSALSNAVPGVTSDLPASTSTSTALNTFHVTTLLATATGTALCSASANTYNQLLEIPYDAQMPRTAKRPLPSHLITPLHAFTFGSVSGLAGLFTLYTCVNPLVASMGLLNIVLYAGIYTPLKRLSVTNTWIGAFVGGIPPLMGWAACTNSLDPFSGQAGAWILALILFAWQFPHFNALSWTIRSEYARGGYRMLSAVNPGMNARVSLRWTVAGALAAAVGAPLVGLTSWTVGLVSLIPNGALAFYAWRFWRAGSKSAIAAARQHGMIKTVPGAKATDRDPRDPSARSLFFVSLVHLPLIFLMMMVGKFYEDWFGSVPQTAEVRQEQ